MQNRQATDVRPTNVSGKGSSAIGDRSSGSARRDDGMRRIRVSHTAYRDALTIAHAMRSTLGGYRPDTALVISALVEQACRDVEGCTDIVRAYALNVFGAERPADDGNES